MKVNELLNKYNITYVPGNLKPNYVKLPKHFINADLQGMNLFNELYQCILSEKYYNIVRTKSGGISITRDNLKFPSYDVRQTKNGVEITLLTGDAMVRLIFTMILNRKDNEEDKKITGTQAWRLFKKTLNNYNIDLEKYRIPAEEGMQLKQSIKPLYLRHLCNPVYKDLTFTNVHHIDFNSSFPAGLVNSYPEFREAINYLFEKRHDNKIYKEILNNSISGYMQSPYVKYGFVKLCKDAILDNFNRLMSLTKELEESGRVPLLYNSDGIWYTGEVYHSSQEGTKLGQWKHDYINCTRFRAKSDAVYEFEDKDGIHIKASGRFKLEQVKPREEWSWEDLYNNDAVVIKYGFDKEIGIYEKTESFNS